MILRQTLVKIFDFENMQGEYIFPIYWSVFGYISLCLLRNTIQIFWNKIGKPELQIETGCINIPLLKYLRVCGFQCQGPAPPHTRIRLQKIALHA